MRRAICPRCGWEDHVDTLDGELRTNCPNGCLSEEGNPISLRPLLHLPFVESLYHELNTERYELAKTGKLQFNYPEGTHYDQILESSPRGIGNSAEDSCNYSVKVA